MRKICLYCGKEVEVDLKEEKVDMENKGVKYSYIAKIPYCGECGEEVYIRELDDENNRIANEKYREAEGLIQVSEIEELLYKYKIGKKPLAQLLGWGEATIIRYLDGLTPSKEYSQTLKRLLGSTEEMQDLLSNNRHKLTRVAAEKLQSRLNEIFEETYKSHDKNCQQSINIARFFLSRVDAEAGQEITPLKLQKLVYYAQAWFLAFFSRPLLIQECQAWPHGPVFPDLYTRFKEYKYLPINGVSDFDDSIFGSEQLYVLDGVWKVYGKYDAKYLEKMTHGEDPWKIARDDCGEKDVCNNIIDKELIREYYFSLREKNDISNFISLNKYVSNLRID